VRPPVALALFALLLALLIAAGLFLSRPGSPTAADGAIVLGGTAAAAGDAMPPQLQPLDDEVEVGHETRYQ